MFVQLQIIHLFNIQLGKAAQSLSTPLRSTCFYFTSDDLDPWPL